MQTVPAPSVVPVHAAEFDAFLVYLNEHLLDNGQDGQRFQPLSRSATRFPDERAASFRRGLALPVGDEGWRRLWVARDLQGQILGHVDLRSHAERFATHRCLLGMGVHRDHRGRGIGQQLIDHAEVWARANGLIEWIDLQVLSSNANALRLYERTGFTKTGEVRDMFRIDGERLSYTSMAKPIVKPVGG